MRMTIGKRITLGFTACVLITATLGGFTYLKLHSVSDSAQEVSGNSIPSIKAMNDLALLQRTNIINILVHVLSTNPTEMAALDATIKGNSEQMGADIDAYERDHLDAGEEHELFAALKQARADFVKSQDRILAASRQNKTDVALAIYHSDFEPDAARLNAALQAELNYNAKAGERSSAELNAAVAAGRRGLVIGLSAAVAIAVVLAFLIVRGVGVALGRMAESLSDGSGQVASAASQVASSSQSLAQGASEQAASLEETSSALEEMSSMTKRNAESAQQAAALSSETKAAADKGNAAMGKMSAAINDIQKSASETAKIIKVIDEIAFQTNLLALNAAVEAARAGEAGKGFAVVAEEVRNLAMRSSEAAKNTASMIEQSVQNSRNGVAIAAEVGAVLQEITGGATKVNALVAEIAAAGQEQSQGIGQVNTAVTQMDKVTQSNAAAAEESASASEELAAQASQMAVVVTDLMALVGTRGQAAAPARPRAAAATVAAKPMRIAPPTVKLGSHGGIPLDDGESDTDRGDFSAFSGKRAA